MRDHTPVVIEDFNGYWNRGDVDSVPLDHWSDVNNMQFIESGYKTRDGLEIFFGLPDVVRLFTFNLVSGDGFLVLDSQGQFFHVKITNLVFVSIDLILTIPTAIDFKYLNINGRAFITPIGSLGEFLYVYNGDGTPARKIAGIGPVDADGLMAAANSGSAGNIEAGVHIFGVVYETNSGFLSQIGPDTLPTITAPGAEGATLTNIPISPNPAVVARNIVVTRAIDPTLYNGDTHGYQFFFLPNGRIDDNTTTTATGSFFDEELLEDASHLLDIASEMVNSNGLIQYHNRMVSYASFDAALARVSYPGEPEAFDQVTGLIQLPRDGLQILNAWVYRDVLYLAKINQTFAVQDNGDDPTSWPITVIDDGIGSSLHGVSITNNEQGGSNIEYVLVLNINSIFIFNGTFNKPELTYKIWNFWLSLDLTKFDDFQILNDVLHQIIYINFPYLSMILIGDYANGFDPKNIRWSKWTFDVQPTTIALFNTDQKLVIGVRQSTGSGGGTLINTFLYDGLINFESFILAATFSSSPISTFTYLGEIDFVAGINATTSTTPVNIFAFSGQINMQFNITGTITIVVVKQFAGSIAMTSGIVGTYSFQSALGGTFSGLISMTGGISGTIAHNRVFTYFGSI